MKQGRHESSCVLDIEGSANSDASFAAGYIARVSGTCVDTSASHLELDGA